MSITISKAAVLNALLTKVNEELVEHGVLKEAIPLEDLCAADVWSNEVFSWYKHTADIDRIRDSDKTFIYQLHTLSELQQESKPKEEDPVNEDVFGQVKKTRKYKLDLESMIRLNAGDAWQTEIEKYVVSPMLLLTLFNPKRGSNDERLQFYKKLETFIDLCHKEIAEDENSGTKRSRDGNESGDKASEAESHSMEEQVQGLVDRSDVSTSFKGVQNRHDVAILEFCASKLRGWILKTLQEKKSEYSDGVCIQVIMRRPKVGSNYNSFVEPLVFRIPATMTVYGFRELLANQLSRAMKAKRMESAGSGENSAETPAKSSFDSAFGSPELMVLRQVSISYDRKGAYGTKSHSLTSSKLGMVARDGDNDSGETPSASMAVATDESEKALVAEAVGPNGSVYIDWPEELCQRYFDEAEFDTEESLGKPEDKETNDDEKVTTVMDCIEKYCQMEQLEETEMWYCNKCKGHVRAWKQFHIYRAPPILIVHLKRFHYSASTHRRNKITSFIDFPLEGMDLTRFVSRYEEGQEPIYDCYAVSNHYGNLGGGHYTAYILADDGTWCHYDDTRVTSSLSPKEVITEAAYVLYYRRRDVEVGQDPILEGQSAAVVLDQSEPSRDTSDVSSNHTAHAEGPDDDNMAVDGDGSSRTSSSPLSDMGSVDGGNDGQPKEDNAISFVPDPDADDSDFPLQ